MLNPEDKENIEVIEALDFDENTTLQLLSYYFAVRLRKPDGSQRTPSEAWQAVIVYLQERTRRN